jgi:site-specific recombinase XerD
MKEIKQFVRNEISIYTAGELPEYIEKHEVDDISKAMWNAMEKRDTDQWKKRMRRNILLVSVLWETGIRVSELVHIRMMDILPQGIRIYGKRKHRTPDEMKKRIGLKDKRERIVPITPYLRQDLINYVFEKKLSSEQRIFPFTTVRVHQLIKQYAKQAGINRNIHAHMFRHGFAVYFLRNGGGLNALQQILGHSTLQSTTVYTKLAPIELQEVVNRIYG